MVNFEENNDMVEIFFAIYFRLMTIGIVVSAAKRQDRYQSGSQGLLAAEVLADGVSLRGEAVAEDGHGDGAVPVHEGDAFGGSGTEGVAVQEALHLGEDTVDEGGVAEQLRQLADEAGAGLAVQSPVVRSRKGHALRYQAL
jgi:hypothetical protein